MLRSISLVITFGLCYIGVFAQSPIINLAGGSNWEGLKPLQSTRKEVEKVLGPSLTKDCVECSYDTENARVHISYSSGLCKGGALNGWNVPTGIILSLTVYPKNEVKLVKTELPDETPLAFSASTRVYQEHGLVLSIDDLSGLISRISFLPKESDNTKRCSGFPDQNPIGALYTPDITLPQDNVTAGLDGLLTEAEMRPTTAVTYIVVYGAKNMSGLEYDRLFDSYEKHLYEKRKASREVIRLVKGGTRKSFGIDVYYLIRGYPPPVPSPDFPSPNVFRRFLLKD